MKKILYHGSENIIGNPIFGIGKETNDYGSGFYCTENIELAKEWACSTSDKNGFVNKYQLDMDNLKVLNLSDEKYNILNWMAILVKYRTFEINAQVAKQAKQFLSDNYYIDIKEYDVVIGYRADDSYFRFAKDFLNNTITIEKLENAMKLGKLGKQVVLISKKAFDSLENMGYDEVDTRIYYAKRMTRDKEARNSYFSEYENSMTGTFISEFMKNGGKL